MAVLKNLKAEQEELARLRAENEKLRAAAERPFRLKIGAKGGLSVYGLGRFPVTLYKEQWVTLLGHADEILEFMKVNNGKLKAKGD
jgi:hypothetical protein